MSNPESIKNLIPRPNRSDMQSLQKPSPPSWQQEILAAYKTGENLLCLFSPDKQIQCLDDVLGIETTNKNKYLTI